MAENYTGYRRYNCPRCGRQLGFQGMCLKCRSEIEREEALNFTAEKVNEMQEYLVENIQELADFNEPAYGYFWKCLAYQGVISEEVARAAVRAEVYCPEAVYYRAPEDVRDILIERLMETEDSMTASRLMCALAMQGDDRALETLYELKKNPKEWRAKLYADPDIYAQIGGWTFDEAGARRQINYPKCYSLEKTGRKDKAVTVGRVRDDKCPHCGCRLIDILSIDGTDKRLEFLGINGKITVTCCVNCVMYTYPSAIGSYEPDGTGEALFPYEGVGQDCDDDDYMDYEAFENNGLELSECERPLFYAADDWDTATIGGFGHWIQDCNIRKCPDCGKPMRYLAQLPWSEIVDGDGSLYIEICPDCRKVSIEHQQT